MLGAQLSLKLLACARLLLHNSTVSLRQECSASRLLTCSRIISNKKANSCLHNSTSFVTPSRHSHSSLGIMFWSYPAGNLRRAIAWQHTRELTATHVIWMQPLNVRAVMKTSPEVFEETRSGITMRGPRKDHTNKICAIQPPGKASLAYF